MSQKTPRIITDGAQYRRERVGFSGNPRLLDNVNFTAVAFSTRHLNKDYSGPLINLTRTSDSAVADFYPGKDGWVDSIEIADWLGGSANTVRPYDQSGNGRDIESGAPSLNLTGINGHPCFVFTNSAATNLKGTFSMTGKALSFLQVSMDTARQSGGGPDFYWGLANGETAGLAFGAVGDTVADYLPGDYVLFGKGRAAGENPRFVSNDGQSSVPTGLERWAGILSASRATLRRNGAALAARVANPADTIVAANQFVIGARTQTGSDGHPGWRLGELILFRNDINAQLAVYEAALLEAWSS